MRRKVAGRQNFFLGRATRRASGRLITRERIGLSARLCALSCLVKSVRQIYKTALQSWSNAGENLPKKNELSPDREIPPEIHLCSVFREMAQWVKEKR